VNGNDRGAPGLRSVADAPQVQNNRAAYERGVTGNGEPNNTSGCLVQHVADGAPVLIVVESCGSG